VEDSCPSCALYFHSRDSLATHSGFVRLHLVSRNLVSLLSHEMWVLSSKLSKYLDNFTQNYTRSQQTIHYRWKLPCASGSCHLNSHPFTPGTIVSSSVCGAPQDFSIRNSQSHVTLHPTRQNALVFLTKVILHHCAATGAFRNFIASRNLVKLLSHESYCLSIEKFKFSDIFLSSSIAKVNSTLR